MAILLLGIYGFVSWLITSLIGHCKVLEVSSEVFELELGTSVVDSKVDNDMMVSGAMLLSDHVIKSL